MTTQEKVDFFNNEFIPMLDKARIVLKPEGIDNIEEETMVKAIAVVKWFPNANLTFLIQNLQYQVKENITDIV